MPQWYMTRFPDNLGSVLKDVVVVRPMPVFEEGGYTSTMGGGTGTAITNQIDPDKTALAAEFLAFAKLTYDANVLLWTDLGFDPMRLDVYDDEALLITMEDFSGRDALHPHQSGIGQCRAGIHRSLLPGNRDHLPDHWSLRLDRESGRAGRGLGERS